MKAILILFLISISISTALLANEVSKEDILDDIKRQFMVDECLQNTKFITKKRYTVHCEKNLHHYNADAHIFLYDHNKAIVKKSVRIAEFNTLHPGMSKTRFKNYKLMAKLINNFDILGATELLPLVSNDLSTNISLQSFIHFAPTQIKKTQEKIEALLKKNQTQKRKDEITLLKRKISQIKRDLKKSYKHYRPPGYLKILEELRRLPNGKEWALILAPRAEGPQRSPTHELVGYYYRASLVKPIESKYCETVRRVGSSLPYACIVEMSKAELGKDKANLFSRRPFLAKFQSGNFKVNLISSHIIFDSPKDDKLKQEILSKAFGFDLMTPLPKGMNQENYARLAEVKISLDFIQKNLPQKESTIYMGDLNLETKNPYWSEVLKSWKGSQLFITRKTSLTHTRVSHDKETGGLSSNYDHFIFNPKTTSACIKEDGSFNGRSFNFVDNHFTKEINDLYLIHNGEVNNGRYTRDNDSYYRVLRQFSSPFRRYGKERMFRATKKTITYRGQRVQSTGIVEDFKQNKIQADLFVGRVLRTQYYEKSYYNYFKQVISDHLPIYVNCSTF